MSKRHTIIGGSTPIPPVPTEVLFQENLVFYAPLNNGELFDYISGEVGQTSPDAFVQWDDNEQMYLLGFDYPSQLGHNCTALRYNSAALKANLASLLNGCTIMIRYKDVYYSGRDWQVSRVFTCCSMPDVWETSPRFNMYVDGYAAGYSGTTIPAAMYNMHTIIGTVIPSLNGSTTAIWYRDGQQTHTHGFDKAALPLSVGIVDKNGHATNTTSRYNTASHHSYVKDCRFYNRVMTASEVQQLTNNLI